MKTKWFNLFPIIFLLVFVIIVVWHKTPTKNIMSADAFGYYSYLPAVFVHHDYSFDFLRKPQAWHNQFKDQTGYLPEDWFIDSLPNNKAVNHFTLGVSLFYLPAFVITETIFGWKLNGTEPPFHLMVVINNIILAFVSSILLFKFINKYFDGLSTVISVLLVSLTTNFLYYATMSPGMSHIPGLIAITSWAILLQHFYKSKNDKYLLIGALFIGLAVLVRPTNAIFALLYFAVDLKSFKEIPQRMMYLIQKPITLFGLAIMGLIMPALQLLFWKLGTDSWVLYSYGDESFNFLNPQIWATLFSPQKGWIIYSPLLVFFPIGLFLAKKEYTKQNLLLFITFLVFLYVISSWWCWYWGGGYSIRALIEVSFIVAIGFACIVEWVLKKPKIYRIVGIVIIPFFIGYNLIRMVQVQRTIVHPTSTSWANLKQAGLKVNLSETEMAELNKHLSPPKPNHKK